MFPRCASACTIPELVARLRELHEKATPGPWSTNHRGGDISARIRGHEVQVALACGQGAMWDERDDAAAIMRANAELIAELRSALPAILDALDHVGDAAAHSPDGGKEEGEPGPLSSDWRPVTEPPTAEEHAWCGGEYLLRNRFGGHFADYWSPQRRPWEEVTRNMIEWLPIPPSAGESEEG